MATRYYVLTRSGGLSVVAETNSRADADLVVPGGAQRFVHELNLEGDESAALREPGAARVEEIIDRRSGPEFKAAVLAWLRR